MDAVIASKAEKRAAKGETLNVYSLDLAPRQGFRENHNKENLESFISHLSQTVQLENRAIRLQLAVRTSSEHWTAVDMEISPDAVKLLNIDAAGDPYSIGVISELYNQLLELGNSGASRFYYLVHAPIDEKRAQSIQYDNVSCSRFALDTLFHLSHLESFTLLESREKELEEASYDYPCMPTERRFNSTHLPAEFAFIYKNTQSKHSFNSLSEELKNQIINKKGQSLSDSEKKHTELTRKEWQWKRRNQAIQHKKQGYQEKEKIS